MPVDEDVRAGKVDAVGWGSAIVLLEVAFDFEVEVLREIASHADPRAA